MRKSSPTSAPGATTPPPSTTSSTSSGGPFRATPPQGQAAIGLYKLDRIVAELADEDIAAAEILVSLEKPADGLAEIVRERASGLGAGADTGANPAASDISVTIDDRNVQNAATIFDETFDVPSEVDRFWSAFERRILPGIRSGDPVHVEARLSEPPEVRQAIADEARRRLNEAGADPDATTVEILSAFKQGFFWLRESVAPAARRTGHR